MGAPSTVSRFIPKRVSMIRSSTLKEVAFEGDFEDAVKFANSEMVRYGSIETFGVCEHRPPNINHFCPDAAGMFPDQLQGVTWRMRKLRRLP